MNLTVNGVEYDVSSPPLTTLLRVLREELDITSPKAGCEQGGCGTCTVLVDGEPRRSCLTAVAAVGGAEITTVEGLGDPESLSTVQQAKFRVMEVEVERRIRALLTQARQQRKGQGRGQADPTP